MMYCRRLLRFDTQAFILVSYKHVSTSVSVRWGTIWRGQEKQNSLFPLTVTVLAWLLINWHCARHTRQLVCRRPLWHQYRSSSHQGLGWRYSILHCATSHYCNKPPLDAFWEFFSNQAKRQTGSLLQLLPTPINCMSIQWLIAERSRVTHDNAGHINHLTKEILPALKWYISVTLRHWFKTVDIPLWLPSWLSLKVGYNFPPRADVCPLPLCGR